MDIKEGYLRSALALDSYDSQKRSGIISAFRQKYIKTGIFPVEFSSAIGSAFDVRNNSDYQDFYIVIKSDVETQIANAKLFLAAVTEYVIGRLAEKISPEG